MKYFYKNDISAKKVVSHLMKDELHTVCGKETDDHYTGLLETDPEIMSFDWGRDIFCPDCLHIMGPGRWWEEV
jgi:hypothetical protein